MRYAITSRPSDSARAMRVLITRWYALNTAIDGMATMMPIAVATSASPTSVIRPAVTLPADSFSSANARMIPMTVPIRMDTNRS